MNHPHHSEHPVEESSAIRDKHEGHHTEDFLKKFWVSLAATVPILLYSDLVAMFTEWKAPAFSGSDYLPFLFGSFVFFYGGTVFLRGAVRELKSRMPGMMTLISMAIVAAYAYSVWSTLSGSGMDLFWESATLIVIMLLGHWLEMKAVSQAKSSLHELAKLLPDTADVMKGNEAVTVRIETLQRGDVVLIRPGSTIPADGIVLNGSSEVNESLLTGESKPIGKNVDDKVLAGSINGDGSIQVKILKSGSETFLAGIMRLIEEAELSKSKLQLLSDRAAFYLTCTALVVGTVTFVSWIYLGAGLPFALERLVTVLVIACPHALGLAIPLVASISTTKAAQNGFFIKRRLALEAARNVSTVLFDKTGTLTKGTFGVDEVIGNKEETLRLAYAANNSSEHPLAKAIVEHSKNNNIPLANIDSFVRIPGKGVSATVGADKILVGSTSLLEGIFLETDIVSAIETHEKEGKTVVHVVKNGSYVGSIALADEIRTESIAAVQKLKEAGLNVKMVTGDSADVASWVSKKLSIDEYFAQVLPENKASTVRDLQAGGEIVAMVGDGINDAPALAQADVGIAVGAGTNVAIESAGIILTRNDPRDIEKIIKLSRHTYSKMMQNLFWATGYNLLAMPVAAGALYVYGITLHPAAAAVLMSLSTVIVAINASLLKKLVL